MSLPIVYILINIGEIFTPSLKILSKTFVSLKKKCPLISHKRLPRHILRLIHKKTCAWRHSKLIPSADNIQKFKLCSNSLRTAIKAYRLNRNIADLCGISSKHFYNIVSKRMHPSRVFSLSG